MVTPVRTWIYDLNNALAGPTQADYYRQTAFRWHQNINGVQPANVAGAWTIMDSCNGAGGPGSFAAGPTSKWLTAANIIPNTGGSNHSWISWRSPSGMVPGGFIYMVWDMIDPAFANWEVWVSTNPFTGGTATARPTSIGEAQANASFGAPLVNDASACNTHMLRTTIGEIVLLNSINGSNVVRTALIGVRPDGGEPGLSWPFAVYAAHFVPGALNWAVGWFNSAGSLTIFNEAGVAAAAGQLSSNAARMGAWVAGISNGSPGRASDSFIDVVGQIAGHNMYVGRVIDIRGAPENLPPNSDQQGDSGTYKRISLNGLWVPLPTPYTINL